jgi:hypothetical protein
LSRRDLIRRGAVIGGVLWAAPVIETLASPALAAGSPAPGFACSYALVVFTQGGVQRVTKINEHMTSCESTDHASDDIKGFSHSCGVNTYSVDSSGNLDKNGTPLTAASTCPFTIQGCTITPNPAVTIDFVLFHDGSFGPAHAAGECGPTTAAPVPAGKCGC